MRTTQVAQLAVRMNEHQIGSLSKHAGDRAVNGSAAVLAAFGIALSSFSLKQMFSKSSAARKF